MFTLTFITPYLKKKKIVFGNVILSLFEKILISVDSDTYGFTMFVSLMKNDTKVKITQLFQKTEKIKSETYKNDKTKKKVSVKNKEINELETLFGT